MSLKTILRNVPQIAVAGAVFILMPIIGFMAGGEVLPMIGSGIGTWLLILSWDRSRKNGAEQPARTSNGFLDAQMDRLGRKAELNTPSSCQNSMVRPC
jgi:hypothetical protein